MGGGAALYRAAVFADALGVTRAQYVRMGRAVVDQGGIFISASMNRRSFFARVFGTAGCIAVNPFKFLGSLAKVKPFAVAPFKPVAGTTCEVVYVAGAQGGCDVTIREVQIFNGSTWDRVEPQ